jgi:ubiquinone/menaquinone biosynthesis C-methylase UbiE
MNDIEKLISEYSEDYCLFLEAAYNEGMMSEGGATAVERMFTNIDTQNKKILDIGFGLGGVAFYLAEKYNAFVTGIEINPWMVEEATRRTPTHLKSRVKFVCYNKPPLLPFSETSFDIVLSKGVLTHVREKLPLFKEIFRVLANDGILVIDDWLSPTQNKWGERLQKCVNWKI